MAAKRHERTQARIIAIKLIYQADMLECPISKILEEGSFLDDGKPVPPYALDLVKNFEEHQSAIDKTLTAHSKGWPLHRMATVDKAILRLAVTEMNYIEFVPVSVAINEAVELARTFGWDETAHRFVNGVLGGIASAGDAGVDAGVSDVVHYTDVDEIAVKDDTTAAAFAMPEDAASELQVEAAVEDKSSRVD